MQKRHLVAIDTNIALDLVAGNETAADALQLISKRIRSARVLVPPIVIQELTYQSKFDAAIARRHDAAKALASLKNFNIQPAPLDSVSETIAENAAKDLQHSGLLPFEECNDALVIAESAVLNCVLVVSNDSHLLEIDPKQLGLFFRERDLPAPIIVSPRELIQKFYR